MKPDALIPDDQKSDLCKSCTKCCTTLGIPTAYAYTNDKAREFYKARGFSAVNRNGVLMLYQKNTCPHLSKSGDCEIYEDRPQACRDYSCLSDLDVLGETGWSLFLEKSLNNG